MTDYIVHGIYHPSYDAASDLGSALAREFTDVNGRGAKVVNKFGTNPDVDSGADEDVWGGGGVYPFQSAAQALEIVSDDANDAAAGTGARAVKVFGLDANWEEQSETVILDGVTAVDLANTYLRVYRAYVDTCGSGGVNAGNLTIRLDSAGVTQAVVGAGTGQTLMAIYTVPAGYTAVLTSWYADAIKATAGNMTLDLRTRVDGGSWRVRRRRAVATTSAGFNEILAPGGGGYPLILAEKTDIRIYCPTASANNLACTGGFSLVLTSYYE